MCCASVHLLLYTLYASSANTHSKVMPIHFATNRRDQWLVSGTGLCNKCMDSETKHVRNRHYLESYKPTIFIINNIATAKAKQLLVTKEQDITLFLTESLSIRTYPFNPVNNKTEMIAIHTAPLQRTAPCFRSLPLHGQCLCSGGRCRE